MAGSVIYHRIDAAVAAVTPDASEPQLYRDVLFVRRLDDVCGHVVADEDGLLAASGEVFYSSSGLPEPEAAFDRSIGGGDGYNGCWSPDPGDATAEYVGVRFAVPVRVTGFQFASDVASHAACPGGTGPCACPTGFALQASNDEAGWTTLLEVADFAGMSVGTQSPFDADLPQWWDGGVFVSDRLDVDNDHYYLAYRMVVSAFKPDLDGNYNVAELLFYGSV